jgi:asparagine synthase (glutamine-hydrolysing)
VCGIYGVIHLDGKQVDPALMSAMGRLTVHRGPDDEGMHADGECTIGMRRLSIIDLSGGHQPLSSADGSIWLVCNGEIYNFRELRQELEAQGCRFRTGSDCEVIIHLYARHGDRFVDHLNGMFGFALWDAVKRRLLIGRDRLGIKPLYYTKDGSRLAFASEAKALLALPGVQARIDPVALDAYLQVGYVPAPLSMFAGIAKLPPASILAIENGRSSVREYWKPPSEVDSKRSETQWLESVREGLERSVRMQMVSDVPIGAFLSGGIDSSAVVAFMAANSSRPIKTYSIGFSGTAADDYYNELPYARAVAQRLGTDHHEILVQPDVVQLLPRLLWHMDEPIADTAFITTYLVSEFARREVTVILSGVGGDELFGGYRRYLGDHYLQRFNRLPRALRTMLVRGARHLPSDRHSAVLNLLRYTKSFLMSADLPLEARYRAYMQVFGDDVRRAMVLRPAGNTCDPISEAFAASPGTDAVNRMLRVDALTQLPDDLLMLTDKMSMAVSLECRVPLLDHELVELAARIPADLKIRGGRLKHVMKDALRGVLPREILDRKKRGFGTPMGAWLKGSLSGLLKSVLSERSVTARGLLDHAVVRQVIAAHEQNREDHTDHLIALLNLEIWCRIYLDQRSPDDIALELAEAIA